MSSTKALFAKLAIPLHRRRGLGAAAGGQNSRTNWSYGTFLARLSRIQSWKLKVDDWTSARPSRLFRRMSAHLMAKYAAYSGRSSR